jgi:hypothetical protein
MGASVGKIRHSKGFRKQICTHLCPGFPSEYSTAYGKPEAADPKVVPMCQNLQIAYKYFELP